LKINDVVKVILNGLMEGSIKDFGIMESNMDTEFLK
jgi:hypothetical protein